MLDNGQDSAFSVLWIFQGTGWRTAIDIPQLNPPVLQVNLHLLLVKNTRATISKLRKCCHFSSSSGAQLPMISVRCFPQNTTFVQLMMKNKKKCRKNIYRTVQYKIYRFSCTGQWLFLPYEISTTVLCSFWMLKVSYYLLSIYFLIQAQNVA